MSICLGSVAGSVIQATGKTDFEDGLRMGTKLEVRNGLQSIRTIPEVNMVSPLGLSMTLGAVMDSPRGLTILTSGIVRML